MILINITVGKVTFMLSPSKCLSDSPFLREEVRDRIPGFEPVQRPIKTVFQELNKYQSGDVKLPLKKTAVGQK